MSNAIRRVLCLVLLVLVGGTAVADSSASTDVLEAAGIKGGLVVHIGCGDGKFTAALHTSDSYIVQGLATDSDAVVAARGSLGKSGDVTIALFDGKTLPYADNLAQLVVADSDSQVAAVASPWAAQSATRIFRSLCRGEDSDSFFLAR